MKNIFASAAIFVLSFVFMSLGTANAVGLSNVFPAFSSRNLDGEPVTGDIFSREKLTMVNIWTTWCPPCIKEMPDLGRLARSMPEGAQLVGIVLDVEGTGDTKTIDDAKRIMSTAKADFLQILPSEEMTPVLRTVRAIPTTIFVNSNGQIIGAPVVGAKDEKGYRAELERRLQSLK
ncbi:MAG: TlpA family protein disulfide reductase [Synergistaceae bacterium]|nr:TlpA family protein disulfide reductase [Synergistaceae bacterium]